MRKKWAGAAIFDLLDKEIPEFVPDCQMSAERLCLVDLGFMETNDHRKGTLSLSISPSLFVDQLVSQSAIKREDRAQGAARREMFFVGIVFVYTIMLDCARQPARSWIIVW